MAKKSLAHRLQENYTVCYQLFYIPSFVTGYRIALKEFLSNLNPCLLFMNPVIVLGLNTKINIESLSCGYTMNKNLNFVFCLVFLLMFMT